MSEVSLVEGRYSFVQNTRFLTTDNSFPCYQITIVGHIGLAGGPSPVHIWPALHNLELRDRHFDHDKPECEP